MDGHKTQDTSLSTNIDMSTCLPLLMWYFFWFHILGDAFKKRKKVWYLPKSPMSNPFLFYVDPKNSFWVVRIRTCIFELEFCYPKVGCLWVELETHSVVQSYLRLGHDLSNSIKSSWSPWRPRQRLVCPLASTPPGLCPGCPPRTPAPPRCPGRRSVRDI